MDNNHQQKHQSLANKKTKGPNHPPHKAPGGATKTNSNGKRRRIQPDNPCPLHQGLGHKWGECHANTCSKDCDQTKCPKGANRSNDAKMAWVVDSTPSDEGPSTPVHSLNNDPSDQGAFECHCYVNQEEIISQHAWDSISFSTEQVQAEQKFAFDKSCASLCEDACSLGDSDITMKTCVDITQSLHLCSISIITTGLA